MENNLFAPNTGLSVIQEQVSDLEEITYANLVEKRSQSQLTPGKKYRITDYITTTVQEETQSAGHQFDIVVTALSEDTLDENARCLPHEGDTYFQNSNLAAWEIKYCLDNDTNKFRWADGSNGKGVIYYMKDENENECPYDFKNIQFKRYRINNFSSSPSLIGKYLGYSYDSGMYPSGVTISSSDYKYVYTFDSNNNDHTLNGKYCFGNIIKFYVVNSERDKRELNNIAFVNTNNSKYCNGNTFNINCKDCSFGDSCMRNTFGIDCYNNIFGNGCAENTFDDTCGYNIFGNNCYCVTFGNSCQNNIFNDYCYYVTFGIDCRRNVFNTSCINNTFGNNCVSNAFGPNCINNMFDKNCVNNKFGNNCSNNMFGIYCNNNTFGDACQNNMFGIHCSNNMFGNSCGYNIFGNDCGYNIFNTNCINNTFGNNCISNIFDSFCLENTFGNGCWNIIFGEGDGSCGCGSCGCGSCGCGSCGCGCGASPHGYYRCIRIDDGNANINIKRGAGLENDTFLQNIHVALGVSTLENPVTILFTKSTDLEADHVIEVTKNSALTVYVD